MCQFDKTRSYELQSIIKIIRAIYSMYIFAKLGPGIIDCERKWSIKTNFLQKILLL